MRNKLDKKRNVLLSIVFLLSLCSFIYVNSPAASGIQPEAYPQTEVEEELYQESLSPEVAAVKFMLGIASFIFTSDR